MYDYTGGKADWIGAGLPTEGTLEHPPRVGAVMDREVATCAPAELVASVAARVGSLCVVVNEAGVVQGRLRGGHFDPNDPRSVEEVMEPGPPTIRPDSDVAETVARMKSKNVTSLLVANPDGVLLGVFTP